MISDAYKQVLDGVEKIPTLPHVVNAILNMLEDPDTSAEDVNGIIRMDPALTSRVLKIVNSAFYGFPRQISTVTQAVVILGFNAIKSLALSASVISAFSTEGEDEEFDRVGFWEHSITTGVIANAVGRRINYPLPEECIIAGILHGIGKLIFDQFLHEQFIQAVKKSKKEKKMLIQTEREIFGFDHTRAGAMLAEKWKLPLQLVESINYYPYPKHANFNQTLVSLVHLGNYVARKKRCGNPGDTVVPRLNEEARKILKLSTADVKKILAEMDEEIDKVDILIEQLLD